MIEPNIRVRIGVGVAVVMEEVAWTMLERAVSRVMEFIQFIAIIKKCDCHSTG